VDFRGQLQAWLQEGFRTLSVFAFWRVVPVPDFLVFSAKLRFGSGALVGIPRHSAGMAAKGFQDFIRYLNV
jgi:hypothetical protein